MESIEVLDELTQLIKDAQQFAEGVVGTQVVDWKKLNWHQTGPGALFEEFKKAGIWSDYVTSTLLDFEQRKNKIVGDWSSWRVEQEAEQDRVIRDKTKRWVMEGMAYQERQAMCRIDWVHGYEIIAVDRKVDLLNAILGVIKGKVAQLNGFKQDAKVAANLMSFGNQLGELKQERE